MIGHDHFLIVSILAVFGGMFPPGMQPCHTVTHGNMQRSETLCGSRAVSIAEWRRPSSSRDLELVKLAWLQFVTNVSYPEIPIKYPSLHSTNTRPYTLRYAGE